MLLSEPCNRATSSLSSSGARASPSSTAARASPNRSISLKTIPSLPHRTAAIADRSAVNAPSRTTVGDSVASITASASR